MAGGAFSVDTDGLSRAVPGVQGMADRIVGVGSGLEGTLRALGAFWGDDAIGEEFLKGYAASRDQLLDGVQGSGAVVRSTAEGIGAMAKGFARLEDDNVMGLRGLSGVSAGDDAGVVGKGGSAEPRVSRGRVGR